MKDPTYNGLSAISLPQWVETNASVVQGHDLLGLRNPVQRIGNSLIDGVTSITPSVRYISLCAWITYEYVSLKQPNVYTSFPIFSKGEQWLTTHKSTA